MSLDVLNKVFQMTKSSDPLGHTSDCQKIFLSSKILIMTILTEWDSK